MRERENYTRRLLDVTVLARVACSLSKRKNIKQSGMKGLVQEGWVFGNPKAGDR